MKKSKKIIGGIAAVAIVAAIALNINVAKSSNHLSDVFLSNVEALANTDIDVGRPCMERSGKQCDWGYPDQPYVEGVWMR